MKPLTHPLLERCGVLHGFGVRGSPEPEGLLRPRQVHGCAVATGDACAVPEPPAADAVVSNVPGQWVGVVTADCVPVLLASNDGAAVAAVHAGWRGLAAGVVAAGCHRLRALAGPAPLHAVVGPYIGPCCYEVDAPVLDSLTLRFGDAVAFSSIPTRAGHARIDLGALAREELLGCGIDVVNVGRIPDACTHCDAERFHSYRRDGEAAGRLVHTIAPRD